MQILQESTLLSTVTFLLVHMLQMELLLILIGTAAAAWILSITLEKQNARTAEQILARKIAAGYLAVPMLLWISARFLK
jgi:hypothetical protein